MKLVVLLEVVALGYLMCMRSLVSRVVEEIHHQGALPEQVVVVMGWSNQLDVTTFLRGAEPRRPLQCDAKLPMAGALEPPLVTAGECCFRLLPQPVLEDLPRRAVRGILTGSSCARLRSTLLQ